MNASLALSYAVSRLKVEAARICLECGADPVSALRDAREWDSEIRVENAAKGQQGYRETEAERDLEVRSRDMIKMLETWCRK